ncbi:MAG: TIGR01777 family protein [Elusimicrobia bacterium]|nr:TIGR01777 family protein [Elusimicrobiota bacterium]
MRIFLAGGTGFIGKAVTEEFSKVGHSLVFLTRQNLNSGAWESQVKGCDAVINLAGESIAQRWSPSAKQRIGESRIGVTRSLVFGMERSYPRPKVLINASAVGYYGDRGDEALTEESAPGTGFLAEVCKDWEAQAQRAMDFGVRAVCLRLGVVLGKGGGALAKMLPPFRMFVGGPLGDGRQWMSWVHIQDVAGLISFCLSHDSVSGAVNATAPEPMTNRDFSKALGNVLGRPSWAPVPGFVLKLLLGEMSDLLLTGQRVLPARARELGYRFRFSSLMEALPSCL